MNCVQTSENAINASPNHACLNSKNPKEIPLFFGYEKFQLEIYSYYIVNIVLTVFGISFLCVALPKHSFAQETSSIRGKVLDSVTKLPVDYATVSIFKSGEGSPFNGGSTNEKGFFVINDLRQGEYKLKVDFLGYRPRFIERVTITDSPAGNILSDIYLSPVQHQLTDVIIKAKAPMVENKIDKMVYNAGNDLTSQGSVAIDLLRKVPMVSVDVDGNVELQGNSNVRFLINGKPSTIFGASLTEELQTIPASQIQSIEVITSPGAKYDMEGTAGIINIILKKGEKNGLNGSINLSAGNRLQDGAFNINAQKDNFGVNAFFSGVDQINSASLTSFNRHSVNTTGDTVTNFNQKGRVPFTRNGYQGGIGFDWNITPTNEVSATFNFDNHYHRTNGTTAQDQQTLLSNGNILRDIMSQRYFSSKSIDNANNYNLTYKKIFQKDGQEMDVSYSSSYETNSDHSVELTEYLDGNYPAAGSRNVNPGRNNETDISADYTQPVSKNFSLQTGLKTTIENIGNSVATDTLLNNNIYAPNAGQTYKFNFRRLIYAAYLSSNFKLFSDFLDGSTGMRFERTNTSLDINSGSIPSYNLWAPSLLLQHKLDETQSLKFTYSYRVERPEYDDLNPFLDIIDPHDINTGNPLVKTEIGHKYEFDYNKSFSNEDNINLSLFYNYNSNDIQSITTYYPIYNIDGTNYYDLSLARSVNIGSQTSYGSNISGSIVVSYKLSFRSDLLLRELVNAMPGQISIKGFCYEINTNASYQILPGLAAEIFGSYTSRRIEFDDTHPAVLFYTAAIKKQFKDKKVSIGLTASNLFNRYVNQLSTNYGSNFTQNDLRQVPLRSIGLTFTFKFGKSSNKKEGDIDDLKAPPLQ